MNKLVCYKTLPKWHSDTLPQAFRQQHNTKAGTWAKLVIFSGSLRYDALDENGKVTNSIIFDKNSDIPFVEPQAWHRVEPMSEDLCCQLSFYCIPEDFYQKKYRLNAPYSEVVELMKYIQSGKVLDLGCGRGRNALFLAQQGFNVAAVDQNPNAIAALQEMIANEEISTIQAALADVCDMAWKVQYDAIISTVVLMFLERDNIPQVIKNMQENTKPGGYNLIVSAMDTEDYPLTHPCLRFDFGFKKGELLDYYRHWDVVKYNENVGHLHQKDEQGNRVALRFATLIAHKKSVSGSL